MKNQGGLILAEKPSSIIGQQILDQFVEKGLVDEILPVHEIIPSLTKSLGLPG